MDIQEDYIKVVGAVGIVAGAVITATATAVLAIINNRISRVKSQNEWRRDKALNLIMEFQDEMRKIDTALTKFSIDLSSRDYDSIESALMAVHIESYDKQYYDQVRVIGQKLELLILPKFRSSFNHQFNQFIKNDGRFYAGIIMGVFRNPDSDESLPERHNFQPLFLEILDNLR
ncbi:hypothetical protein QDR00_21895 [Serratia ureilytica]|uniref:hypothetical protein n=1 Tax=Serratia ureilytica TaxID=300181 RepID=UPI00313B19D5